MGVYRLKDAALRQPARREVCGMHARINDAPCWGSSRSTVLSCPMPSILKIVLRRFLWPSHEEIQDELYMASIGSIVHRTSSLIDITLDPSKIVPSSRSDQVPQVWLIALSIDWKSRPLIIERNAVDVALPALCRERETLAQGKAMHNLRSGSRRLTSRHG